MARRKRVIGGRLPVASSFVYQIHLAPLRFRSSAGAPIHFAAKSSLVSRPVSKVRGGAPVARAAPASSQTRTFSAYFVADSSAGPP